MVNGPAESIPVLEKPVLGQLLLVDFDEALRRHGFNSVEVITSTLLNQHY